MWRRLQKARRYEDAPAVTAISSPPIRRATLVEGAYRNVADSFRYAGKDQEAIEWSRRIQQRFAGQPLATVGLYNEAKIELTRKNHDAAIQLLLQSLGAAGNAQAHERADSRRSRFHANLRNRADGQA